MVVTRMNAKQRLIMQWVFIACLLTLSACASKKGPKEVEWLTAIKTGQAVIENPQANLVGEWLINPEYRQLLDKQLKAFRSANKHRRRAVQRQRSPGEKEMMRGMRPVMSSDLSIKGLKKDPRLSSLHADQVVISQAEGELIFRYADYKPIHYATSGQPVSHDGNISVTMAEWEKSRFVIELNGPRGTLIEEWTPSPDGQQLHLSVFFRPQISAQPMQFNRLFDRRTDRQASR